MPEILQGALQNKNTAIIAEFQIRQKGMLVSVLSRYLLLIVHNPNFSGFIQSVH
ncbi:MAG: hypothetical protein ACXV8J_04295 [Methylobacter sp.]